MKDNIIKIGLFLFILCFTVQGCEKDNILESNILGKWQLLYSVGGIVGKSYPSEGHIYTLEFTEDNILTGRLNNIVDFETKYSISFDTLTYSRGASTSYIIDITNGTLTLTETLNGFSSTYKRNRH